jgi:hypothetical protein
VEVTSPDTEEVKTKEAPLESSEKGVKIKKSLIMKVMAKWSSSPIANRHI